MNLLLLPGNGIRNLEWLPRVDQVLAPSFEQTAIITYKHWETGESEIDLEHETTVIAEKARVFEPYAVFAKSAGSMVTMMATANKQLHPKWALFAGLPLVMITDHSLPAREWFNASTMPITIVQNDSDPYGSSQQVHNFVNTLDRRDINVVEASGNSHDYNNLALLKHITDKLIEVG